MSNDKYIQYMENAGGVVPIAVFGNDWEPIGGTLLDSMIRKGEVELQGMDVVLISPDSKYGKPKEVNYMIGQRAIYADTIVTVCHPENDSHLHPTGNSIWIDNPQRGYKHHIAAHNLKPLPNGQV